MTKIDLRVLRTLATMARGVALLMPPSHRMPREAFENRAASLGPDEMFRRGHVTVSHQYRVEVPKDGTIARREELSMSFQFVREIPELLLRMELHDARDTLQAALMVLTDSGFIQSHLMELALPIGRCAFCTSHGGTIRLEIERFEGRAALGTRKIKWWSPDDRYFETGSRMRWYTIQPKGWERLDLEENRSPHESNEPDDSSGKRSPDHVADDSPELNIERADPIDDLKPSHARAKALYEWAMENIKGAERLTYSQLFDALTNNPHCDGEGLPGNAETFARYCRAAGVRRNTPRHHKGSTRTVRRKSDI